MKEIRGYAESLEKLTPEERERLESLSSAIQIVCPEATKETFILLKYTIRNQCLVSISPDHSGGISMRFDPETHLEFVGQLPGCDVSKKIGVTIPAEVPLPLEMIQRMAIFRARRIASIRFAGFLGPPPAK